VATLSFTEEPVRARTVVRQGLPAWQRVTIGAASGIMPVALSLAVVQGAPVMEAVDVLLLAGRDSADAASNAMATLLGLGVLTTGLGFAGVISALCQRRQAERLALFQTSLVAPALLFVAIHVVGMAASPRAGGDGVTGAQVLITGVTPVGGDPVRIAVYKRQAPDPVACFAQGLRGRGC